MTENRTGKDFLEDANGHRGVELYRRDLLLAAGTALRVGFDSAVSSDAKAATGSGSAKIDAHTHFAPLKFLEFAEAAEGRPFGLSSLYRSLPALTKVQARIDLLDRNSIDMNVLVPVPWIEGFPKVFSDPVLASKQPG